MTDVQRFAKALAIVAEVFNEPISEVKVAAYWDALRDLGIDDLERSIQSCVKYNKFFPRPADIREVLEGAKGDQWEYDLSHLQGRIVLLGKYTPPEPTWRLWRVVRALGGWRRVCELNHIELRRNFKTVWQVMDRELGRTEAKEIGREDTPPIRIGNDPKDQPIG